jgi:Fe-S-cluster containining protein
LAKKSAASSPRPAAFPPSLDPARASGPPPCDRCTARCCGYFALQIDRPVTAEQYDQIRWFLVHEKTAVWVEEGDWFLEVRNPCRKLTTDHSCGIYATRPDVCREYGAPGAEDSCEFDGQGLSFDLYFDTPEAFEAWSREELARRDARLAKRRERRRARASRPEEAIA